MAYTYSKIASVTVGSGGANTIDFLAIPQNYTDLVIKLSARTDNSTAIGTFLKFNSSSTSYSDRGLEGTGSAAASYTNSGSNIRAYVGVANWSASTTSTFSSYDIYIPNYANQNYKSISVDQVTENNATSSWASLWANLWSNSSPITSITLFLGSGNFVQHTTATLYGIKAEV